MLYQEESIIESLGFFLSLVYLPTYDRTMLGAKPFLASLTIILANGSTAIGTAMIGSLTNHLHVNTCIMICTVGAQLGIFLLWGFARHLETLYLFSVAYRLFAGSYMATWAGIVRQINSHAVNEGTAAVGQAFDPTMILGGPAMSTE
jgi:MFS family permease